MSIIIRPPHPDVDYPNLARLLNQVWREPVTPTQLQEGDAQFAERGVLRRRVAVIDDDLVGYSVVRQNPSDEHGRFFLWIVVDSQWRRKGIGSRILDEVEKFVIANDAAILISEVNDDDRESQRFAETRGFTVHHHLFESVIDLHQFDDSQFTGLIESVTAAGICLTTLAEEGDSGEARRKLHRVNFDAYLDDPASSEDFFDFDTLNHIFDTSAWFRPEGQFLAVDGGEYVGLAAVGYFEHTNSMYNMITGVDRAYRGRKIAQALKLLTIRYAQSCGADYIRTDNDSRNVPMLAINRKLGYKKRGGEYSLVKKRLGD